MTTNYLAEVTRDALNFVDYLEDQIAEKLAEDGEASTDYNNDYDGGDSYHHETHVDQSYNLSEAAALLEALSDHEETDSGLWEGQEPRAAIATQAAFTYGNAVSSEFQSLIESINEDFDDEMQPLFADRDEKIEELRNERDELQTEIDEYDNADDEEREELAEPTAADRRRLDWLTAADLDDDCSDEYKARRTARWLRKWIKTKEDENKS